MDGTLSSPTSAEPLKIHGLPERARSRGLRRKRGAQQHDPERVAHHAWLTQPARTHVRRPLSPTCRLIIGERLPPPTFWQRPIVQRIAPWVGSIAIHVAIIAFGFITFRAEHPRIRGGVPIAGSIAAAQATVTVNIGAAMQPVDVESVDKTVQDQRVFPVPHEPEVIEQGGAAIPASLSLPTDESATDAIMLGVGAQALPTLASSDGSMGTPTETRAKQISGASTATFFGVRGTGQAIVYVCDASGSMMGTNELIINQLQRSLLAMDASQVFNVSFFSGRGAPVVFDARDMIPADANNKLAACAFAKRYSCGGNSRGLPAIKAALKRNPDVTYLVTDGDFDDSDEILVTIRAMNGDGFTKINVILVSGAAKNDPTNYKFLKQIADENGGTCRVVDPNGM